MHIIQSGNVNDQTNISVTIPYLLYSPSGNTVTPFHAITHLPSSPESPNTCDPSLGKASLHRKIQNQGIYLPQNHHIGHRMFMAMNGHYWVPVSHNCPAPEVFY